MECPENQKITPYISDLLTKVEEEAFEQHLFYCDECFKELKLIMMIADVVKTEGRMKDL